MAVRVIDMSHVLLTSKEVRGGCPAALAPPPAPWHPSASLGISRHSQRTRGVACTSPPIPCAPRALARRVSDGTALLRGAPRCDSPGRHTHSAAAPARGSSRARPPPRVPRVRLADGRDATASSEVDGVQCRTARTGGGAHGQRAPLTATHSLPHLVDSPSPRAPAHAFRHRLAPTQPIVPTIVPTPHPPTHILIRAPAPAAAAAARAQLRTSGVLCRIQSAADATAHQRAATADHLRRRGVRVGPSNDTRLADAMARGRAADGALQRV